MLLKTDIFISLRGKIGHGNSSTSEGAAPNELSTTGRKPNDKIQLDYIASIVFGHRRFPMLISIEWFSRWSPVRFCEAPVMKTATNFLEQFVLSNGIARNDKGTAFTRK